MPVLHVFQELGQKLQTDQRPLKRIVRQLASTHLEIIEDPVLVCDMPLDERQSQGVLVGEVIEEPTTSDVDRRDNLLDRRGVEPSARPRTA